MKTEPRLLRAVGPPLALYLRPGRNDHQVVLQRMAEGEAHIGGLVFDPRFDARHRELREEAQRRGVETIVDPKALELGTHAGSQWAGMNALPWASELPHSPDSLRGKPGADAAARLAEFATSRQFTAVLAPAHYIVTARDEWMAVDVNLTSALRRKLDESGGRSLPIYYPLAVPAKTLRDSNERQRLIAALRTLPIDAVWLRVHPFGPSTSGGNSLRGYIEACWEFHSLGLPLVGERTGSLGLALMAFGAVGGIESGITVGERFDIGTLLRLRTSGSPFAPQPRVYVPEIGAFISRQRARAFFANRRMKTFFGCKSKDCCPRGVEDTIRDPRRHFILRRSREVSELSSVPEPLRASNYLEDFLRPATDQALIAAGVEPGLEAHRRRLEGWRRALGSMHRNGPVPSWSKVPDGRRVAARKHA